jgi:DNA-binding transcriptional ArsR family regulator
MAALATRVRIDPDAPQQLARLAVVFADPIRLKVVTELFRREMSPSQFHELYGGGTLSRVDRHFKKLAHHGWLRLVREARGGRRRGGVEHFYRAPELAVIEEEMWAPLPPAVRAEYSWRTFEQFAERVEEAMAAGTFDARSERHLTWTPLVLDEQGRSQILIAAMRLFRSLLEEQADAKVRMADSGEKPMESTAGIAVFDSPRRHRNRSGLLLPPATGDEGAQSTHFTVRIAKVLASPLRMKIVTELNLREMSASGFYEEFGGAARLSDVTRCFKSLAEDGWLTKIREETGGRRRGATEHFYRATGPAVFDKRNWMSVPEAVREGFSWRVFEQLAEQVREAMTAGTFDARPDRHHTWTPLVLDQVGWEQVIRSVDDLFYQLLQEQMAAKVRLARSGEEPLIATVYLAAFESPPGSLLSSWTED